MTFLADTYSPYTIVNTNTSDTETRGNCLSYWSLSELFGEQRTKDVFIEYHQDELVLNISEKELSEEAVKLSESAFAEMWDDEDDEYWGSY